MDHFLPPWYTDAENELPAVELMRITLAPPNLEPFATYVAKRIEARETRRNDEVFEDALFDLTRLLEEVSFQSAVAATYLEVTRDAREALRAKWTNGLHAVPLSSEVKALLAPYRGSLPGPATLITDPNASISGFRILGGWWAAQLIDSALLRSLSSLDRLATMLTVAAGQAVNAERMPAFRKQDLKPLRSSYGGPDWNELYALLTNPLFIWVKNYRDGFIHRRRQPMQLHGDHTFTLADGSIFKGIDADDHLAFVRGMHHHIIGPACDKAGRLISS